MVRFRLLLAAEYLVRDADSQKTSAFNIFDAAITPEGFPVLVPNFGVLTVIDRDAEDGTQFTALLTITLGEQQLMRGEFPVNFQQKLVHRHFARVAGLIIPGPGRLSIRAALPGDIVATYDIPVSARQQPTLFEGTEAPAADQPNPPNQQQEAQPPTNT